MVRPTRLLYPQREPAPARPAATILLLREHADGYQVLMTRRSPHASFGPSAFVFPGGTVDAADGSSRAHSVSRCRPDQSSDDRRFAVAAIREAFEEIGILLATTDQSSCESTDTFASQTLIDRLNRSQDADFFGQIAAHALTLAVDQTAWLAHWITDRDLPKRFDTRFLLALAPSGQTPVADDGEQFEPLWISPSEALRLHVSGQFSLMFPTVRTLRRMAAWPNAKALLEACIARGPHWVSSPRAGYVDGRIQRFAEEESPYGELAMTSPDGQIRHHLDWQSERPVRLLDGLSRLTAPNPGRMTGPGTNTYLLGTAKVGYIVIDPGPPIAAHVERIAQIVGDRLDAILCTHSHPDHSPGAALLKSLTGAPIKGAPSAPTANAHSFFRPDETLIDGQVIRLGDQSIRVVATPGHATNHLCLFIEEDRLLFSGDHVLNGSTTIVDPPDGDMSDYLHSLDRLAALDPLYILPAHGYVLAAAAHAIAQLKAHRLRRESKVLEAVTGLPGAGLPDLVKVAYDDTAEALHGIAMRSLLAHLLKLVADDNLRPDGEGWRRTDHSRHLPD